MYSGITSGRVLNGELLYTKILEVNLFAFAYRLFHRDFSPINGTQGDELPAIQGCVLWDSRVIIPKSLRSAVLEELHCTHPGMTRMKELARSYIWWPNLNVQIEQQVS